MKLNSLYKFYQKHFNYTSKSSKKQKIMYAYAISDAVSLLREIYELKEYNPLNRYLNSEKKHSLAIKFLDNVKSLAENRYTEPLDKFILYDTEIIVDKTYLSSSRKEIIIPCQYICDKNNEEEIIFLTFGSFENMTYEVAALKGLVSQFKIGKPFPKNLRYITYWDLSSGKENTVDYTTIKAESRKALIETLNKFWYSRIE